MYKKPEIAFILIAILVKLFLVKALSVSFEYDWIYQMWHFIDVEYLKKDLLKSLYYFHYQPPVFNLFLGLILKQKIINPESLLYFSFNLMTIGMFGGMFFYYKARTNRKIIYALLPVIFLFSPQTIIYENWPIYTWTSSFLILMGYFCLSKLENRLMLKSLIFFSLMALLILSRSAFHPVFYIFFILFFSIKYRKNVKEFIIGATIPSLIILSIMIKNKIEFGFVGVGSGLGFSLYKIVSKKDLDNRIQKSKGELDDIMKITPVKSVSTYLSIEEAIYNEKHKKINLLSDEFKSTRKKFGDEFSVNLGNIHYLDLAKRYQKGALYLIKNYPLEYIQRVSKALIMFFKPSWDHGFGVENNRNILAGYMNFFYLESLRLKVENLIYKIRKPWPLRDGIALSSYLITPFFYGLCLFLILWRFKNKSLNIFKLEEKYVFSLVTIIYLVSVSSLIELAENDRYRVMIDPMVFVTLISLLIFKIDKKLRVNQS